MTDIVAIGFQYTGGLTPMLNDVKLATNEVNKLDSAQAALKRTEEQAEKVAGRLAMTLREKNNVLKATISGSEKAVQNAKLENLENRLLAQGINKELIPAILKVQKENLELEKSAKAVTQAQRMVGGSMQESTKEARKNSVRMSQAAIQFEQFFNQLQGGANPLLAFSQQAADLGIVLGFGLAGAVAGITGAFVSLLGPAVIDLTDKSKELEKEVNELNESFQTTSTGATQLSTSLRVLVDNSESLGKLALVDALQDARSQLRATDASVKDLVQSLDVLEQFSLFGGEFGLSNIDTITRQLGNLGLSAEEAFSKIQAGEQNVDRRLLRLANNAREVQDAFKVTQEQSLSLGNALGALEDGATADEMNNLRNVLTEISSTTSVNSKEFQALVEQFLPVIKAFEGGAKAGRTLRDELNGINTSLRFDESDSIDTLISKLDEAKTSTGDYSSIIKDLETSLVRATNQSVFEFAEALEFETSLITKSKEEQEILNFERDLGTKITSEQKERLIELVEARERELNKIKEQTKAQKEAISIRDSEIAAIAKEVEEFERLEQNAINLSESLELQIMAQTLGADAAKRHAFEQKILSTTTGDTTEDLLKQYDSLQKLIQGNKDAAKSQKELNSLLSDVEKGADRIGTAFQTSGNGIIDTFGEAITVLGDFSSEMERLEVLQQRLNESNLQGAELTAAQNKLDEQRFSANLSGISSMLGASKNLFDEQSKERKALHALEMGFLVAEMAMAAQKAVANAVVAITNQGSGDPYTAFGRIAAMTAIMAGVVGAIGATVSGGGGSAPTVGPAGTGTILGDDSAQSDSISASQERFEDIQLDQLAELRGIHDGISDLSGAINVLTRNIISAGNIDGSFATGLGTSGQFDSGGFSAAVFGVLGLVTDAFTGGFVSDILDGLIGGLFGGKTTAEVQDAGIKFMTQNLSTILETGIVDAVQFANVKITEEGGLFGLLSDDVSFEQQTQALGEDFTRQLGDIIGSIADTLLVAGDTLDIAFKTFSNGATTSLEDALDFFVIPELDISFEGKTGEEIEQELNALFSSIGDDLATFLFPQLLQYQQINEGMFETVLRVTQETVVFADALDLLGSSMSTSAVLDFGQSVITAMGDLENFTDAFGNFYQEFFTEQERANNTLQSLTEVFAQLGLTVPETKEDYRELVEETAAMGIEGAETLAVLLEVSGAFADMRDTLDQLAASANDGVNDLILLVDFFNGINDANNEFFSNFELTGPSFASLIEAFGSGGEVAAAVQALANNFANAGVQMDVAQEGITSSITGILAELNGINEGTATDAEAAFLALRDSMGRTSATADELDQQMLTVINSLTQADLDSGLLEQILRIQGGIDSYIESLRQQEQALESATNTLNNREMDMMIQLLELQGKSSEALALTRSRELEELQKIDEANRELGLQSNLADLQAAIFLQEDYNKALEDSKTATSAAYDALNEAVTAQVSVLTDLVNELESQRNRIQSALRQQDVTTFGGFDLAMKELQEVLAAVTDGNLSANDLERVSALDLSTLTAGDTSGFSSLAEFTLSQAKVTNSLRELDSVLESAESAEQAKIDALNAELSAAKDQRDALLGIQEATLDLTDLEGEIASRDEVFQTEAERLADLQLAELEGLLTEEEQQRLNQALEDAIGTLLTQISTLDTSGLADIFVEITQLSQAVNELPSGLTDSFNNLKSSIDLIPEKMDEIWSQKQDYMQEHVSFMETWKDSQITLLQDILNSTGHSGGSDTPVFDSLGIISELQTLNATLRELTSNQWHQNRNTLPRIVDATEYLRDSLINDDRRKVSLPNSHYKGLFAIQDATEYLRDSLINDDRRKVSLPNSHYRGLFAIQDATEYLRDSLINDDRRKVSLPNSHYKLLTRNADASEYLVNSLINDDRRKVSLPNSHYNNQTEIIEELKSLRAEINDMAATQESIGKANLSANRKTSEINQRFEINGIDTNTSTT